MTQRVPVSKVMQLWKHHCTYDDTDWLVASVGELVLCGLCSYQ